VRGQRQVCALLSGGNIDPTLLISVMRHGLTVAGRYLVLRSRLRDRPGELIRFLEVVADTRAQHRRDRASARGCRARGRRHRDRAHVVTRNEQHCLRLIAALESHGYPVERLR
jgi:threonine dehydratase